MTEKDFEGFDFITKGLDLIIDNIADVKIMGDPSDVDNYFSENMIKLDEEINCILREID